MKITNQKVTLNVSGVAIDIEVCGEKNESNGKITVSTVSRESVVGDFSNGATWLLEYPEIVADITAQLESMVIYGKN